MDWDTCSLVYPTVPRLVGEDYYLWRNGWGEVYVLRGTVSSDADCIYYDCGELLYFKLVHRIK